MGSEPLNMPLELFKRIADQAAEQFPKVKLGFAFTEPLIYPYLDSALKYARIKKLYTSITTNGLGLKKWANAMAESKLDELNLSLDGPEEIHNFIRGNKNSFSLALDGINELATKSPQTKLSVFCVVTEWNVTHLMEFMQEMNKHPVSTVGLMHPNFTLPSIANQHNNLYGARYPATASNTSDTNVTGMDTEKIWNEITAIKNSKWNFKILFFPELNTFLDVEKYYTQPTEFIGKRCTDIFSSIMIKSNGDVIPAHGRCYNLVVGNLYKQELSQIWNSAVFSSFRKTVTKAGGLLPACSRCCGGFSK